MLVLQVPKLKTTLENLLYHSAITISQDSRWIVIGSEMGWIQIWDQQRNCYIHKILSRCINDIALSDDVNWLAYSEASDPIYECENYQNYVKDPKLWVINLKNSAKQFRLEENTNFINCIKFTSSNLLISASKDLFIRIWSVDTRQMLQKIKCYFEVIDLSIHRCEFIFAAIEKNTNKILIYVHGKKRRFWATNILTQSIQFSCNGRMLVTEGISSKQIYQLWDFHTGKRIRKFYGSSSFIKIAKFSQNNEQLVIKNQQNKIAFIDLSMGNQIKIYEKVAAEAQICFSPDCNTMVCDDLWEKVFVYTL